MSTRQARTADKSANDKHTRILKALLQKPGNKFCVDCRKKVKSVDLDSWTVEQVENMIKWGNEKANMYWEARLPERNIPNESTSGIDPWIRSKYEHKQFAQKGGLPDPSELGPIDEAMLMDLYGKTEPESRTKAQMSRSSESSGGFSGMIAPPPANPTRSSFPKRPTSSGVQGADLFSIGQRATPAKASPAPAQEDFFGFNDPVPASAPAQKASNPAPSSAAQDLFSMATPASTQAAPAATAATAPAKAGNSDWKTNIMSLYGSQPSAPKPNTNSNGFGQPAGFGQLQGMDAFGFGQASAQQQPQQQQQHNPWGNNDGFGAMQGASAPTSNSSFDAFGTGSNQNNGFGAQNNNNGFAGFSNNNGFGSANNNNNNNNNNNYSSNGGFGAFQNGGFSGAQNNNNGFNNNDNSMPQGGDLFNLLAGAARSPTATPQNNNSNKNSSAFGDLSWN
ncbi:hypothetical protein BGX24_000733 [Mortierella sp. AD032]|nr:hypothetical protein BGX24_000733 [Mortierella sp. AD032]